MAAARVEDVEDYVIYGTPLESEDDLAPRKRRQALESGLARNLRPWQQEVLDENGRRRFHGAFTGGFSAGYFNTVGSKEGWTPKMFTSSRKKRAEVEVQSAYDFMDDSEKEELDYKELGASSEFDTFGFKARQIAHIQAAQEIKKRPSAIPGFLPDELIVSVPDSIGIKLLLKMGWRHGRAIGPSHIAAAPEARREALKAMLALAQSEGKLSSKQKVYGAERPPGLQQKTDEDNEDAEIIVPTSTPAYVICPKNDLYGLGFDPYKNAPEFRERKRLCVEQDPNEKGRNGKAGSRGDIAFQPSLFRPNAGKMGPGFGIGALEELDFEDEDVYNLGPEIELGITEEDEVCALKSESSKKRVLPGNKQGVLPGFKPALLSECKIEWFMPPVVPPDFVAKHEFTTSLNSESFLLSPTPMAVPPPEDLEIRRIIDGLATFVARCGQKFEDLSREKNVGNDMFQFLFGGSGHDYYKRKLWEERKKCTELGKGQIFQPTKIKEARLDSEQRGRILGEIPLERRLPAIDPEDRSRLQSVLSSTFTKASSEATHVSAKSQPFKDDPARQARFEQFLKDKFEGGLRTLNAAQASSLTELQRAQEHLEFEAVHDKLTKAQLAADHCSDVERHLLPELQTMMGDHFTSASESKPNVNSMLDVPIKSVKYPRREEQPWRPVPLLCKRFNLLDPYAGKPPPPPKPRSRTESFILVSNPVKSDFEANQDVPSSLLSLQDPATSKELRTESATKVVDDSEEQVELDFIIEKPLDLYKAIFSDESEDDEKSNEIESQQGDKSAEAAHAALNRLEAGDFLESLGKELGLIVPPRESRITKKGTEHSCFTDAMNDDMNTRARIRSPDVLDNQIELVEVDSMKMGLAMDSGKCTELNTRDPDICEANEVNRNSQGTKPFCENGRNTHAVSRDQALSLVENTGAKEDGKGREDTSKSSSFVEIKNIWEKSNNRQHQREAQELRRKEKKHSKKHKWKREPHKEHQSRKKDKDKEQKPHKHRHHSKKHHRHRDATRSSSSSSTSSS